jgi:hypothetical protein
MVASCPARGPKTATGRLGAAPLDAAVRPPVPGLDFRGTAAELLGTGPDAALVVEGEVANMSSDAKPVPLIELQRCRRERRWWFASHPPATASSRAGALARVDSR